MTNQEMRILKKLHKNDLTLGKFKKEMRLSDKDIDNYFINRLDKYVSIDEYVTKNGFIIFIEGGFKARRLNCTNLEAFDERMLHLTLDGIEKVEIYKKEKQDRFLGTTAKFYVDFIALIIAIAAFIKSFFFTP